VKLFSEYNNIQEGFLKKIKTYLLKIINSLGFGKSASIPLGAISLNEATKQTKGGNGFVAEYVCAYELAKKLDGVGLKVTSDIEKLKSEMKTKTKQFSDAGLDSTQIRRATNQGEAIAESMFQSIIKNGEDLVFVDYKFKHGDHSYEVRPTGADTGKVTADDIELIVTKESKGRVETKILVSLKAYASSNTSLGSNSSVASLQKMFIGGEKQQRNATTDAAFVKAFGALGKEMLDALEDYKNEASGFMKSNKKPAKELRAYWDAKGKKASKKTGLYPNNLRAQEVGDNYTKKRGYKQEHKLSEIFVKLYNKGKTSVRKNGKESTLRKGLMEILGVDTSVVTYNAIANAEGVVTEVVNSNVSDSYRRLYLAIMNGADVNLTTVNRNGKSTIKVEVVYKGEKINGLTMSMWKDGTLQFKFDSKK